MRIKQGKYFYYYVRYFSEKIFLTKILLVVFLE